MYLKIIGCCLILICSSLMGFFYGENLKKRVFELKEMEQALLQLQSEIVYTHTSLPEIFRDVGVKCNGAVGGIFKKVSKLLYKNEVDSVHEAFKKVFEQSKSKLSLMQYDIELIMNLSKSLGESDIQGQENILSLTLENIKKQISSAEIRMNKNVKVYRYLGFSFGAILIIIII